MKIMDETNTSIFTQAKIEYTQQLIDVLSHPMTDGIKSIYDESKVFFSTQTNLNILTIFRGFLEKVPSWNNELVENETDRIIKTSNCDWLDDLVTAVFISHTKILTSIGPNLNNAKINLTIPKTINFIHKCYINLAREIWKNPYLFNENITGSEYQKNMRTIELITKDSIENTVRKLLPIKDILKEHLETYDTNEKEIQKRLENQNLQTLLLKEIRSLKNNISPNNSDNSDNDDDDYVNDEPSPDKKDEKIERNILEALLESTQSSENKTISENIKEDVAEVKPSDNGYESPDENKVKEECDNLEINTIQDITAETNDNITEEIKYDNADIIDKSQNIDISHNLSDNMKLIEDIKQGVTNDKNEINLLSPKVVKIEPETFDPLFDKKEPDIKVAPDPIKDPDIKVEPEIKVEPVKDENLKDITMSKDKKDNNNPNNIKEIKVIKSNDLQSIGENKVEEPKIELKTSEELKSPLKEIITVEKNNDDNETIDDFFNDINNLMKEKGLGEEKEVKKYTLFDDADENE